MHWLSWMAIAATGYLLGSIPFGVVLTRWGGAGDVRQIGSGNIGATNVLRTGRKELAAATLFCDLAKGAAAVWIGARLAPGGGVLAGVMAFTGHCFPMWLKFHGGKGISTMMGVVLLLHWPAGLVYAVVWLAVLFATRISSLSGISAGLSALPALWLTGRPDLVPVTLLLVIILLWQHRANIGRLTRGEEPKIK